MKQHQHAYQNDGKGNSSSLGTAAAMQALKKFTQSDNSASSASGQGAFLGMAMAEASKVRFSVFAPEARVLQRDVSLGILRLYVYGVRAC